MRYLIEGGKEKGMEEIGAPSGTTFLARNLFFNTPARKKFLKTAQTEAGYVSDIVERIALSHPDISFKFISNNQTKLHTSGNGRMQDMIYHIYGRNLIEINGGSDTVSIRGFIGKPVVSRGNRNYENYFVNGRYIRSQVISRAIEDAYHTFVMKHQYPFTVLQLTADGKLLDINVHPTKMELRFADGEKIYRDVYETVRSALSRQEMIAQVSIGNREKPVLPHPAKKIPEPFETVRRQTQEETVQPKPEPPVRQETEWETTVREPAAYEEKKPLQMELFDKRLLSQESVKEHRIIGQVFDTYWIVQFQDKLFIIDQHAAHEKVLYERIMKSLQNREYTSQNIDPPVILTLTMSEAAILQKYRDRFAAVGFEIEEFGGSEYALRAVPDNLFGLADRELFLEMLDALAAQADVLKADMIDEKIASMSCKAAVKGNSRLSTEEIHALIRELLTLENPYHCPHGRPTIISMSKYELERKFKRIV